MLATLGGAALTIAAALALGAGIRQTVAPRLPLTIAGGVGYAALICIATVLVRAPGRAITALVVLAALALAGAWGGRELRPRGESLSIAAASVVAVLALLLLPFLAAGHFGPLGVGIDNDLGFHVGWVYDLAHGPPPARLFSFSYPLGGESLAACLTTLGIGDEQALIGISAAALALTGVGALGAVKTHAWWVRLPIAVACAVPFLSAGYFGEGSFKEPIMGLLVLTLALALWDGIDRAGFGEALVLLVLSVAPVFIFGPAGLVWPVAFVAARLLAARWRRPGSRAALIRQAGVVLAAAGAVAVIAVLANALGHKLGASGFKIYLGGPPNGLVGGNFARQLPLSEGFGVWFGHDFRYPFGAGVFATGAVVLAIVLSAAAAFTQLREWRTTLVLPVAAAIAIYLAARATTIPYFSAKLMVSAGPLLVLFVLCGALRLRSMRAFPCVLALAYCVAVIWSSAGALRHSPVDDPAFGAELASFQPLVIHHTVVFLGDDAWAPEWLRGATLLSYATGARLYAAAPKPDVPPFDFDSASAALLNAADYVIATRTLDASQPPGNWKLTRTTAHYQLFARHGTTLARAILDEQSAPGATLDCSQPAARALSRRPGIAAVRPAPVASSPWRNASGAPLALGAGVFMAPGEVAYSTLRAPPGRTQLSLAYSTSFPLTLRVGVESFRLAPTLEPYGPLFRAAVIEADGSPLTLSVKVPHGHVPISNGGALIGSVYAVPADAREMVVPLRAACGRYVDWYRLGAG